jgi:hypothetical protein
VETEAALFIDGKINHQINLSQGEALYLISIFSQAEVKASNGEITTRSEKLTQFYVNYSK